MHQSAARLSEYLTATSITTQMASSSRAARRSNRTGRTDTVTAMEDRRLTPRLLCTDGVPWQRRVATSRRVVNPATFCSATRSRRRWIAPWCDDRDRRAEPHRRQYDEQRAQYVAQSILSAGDGRP